MKEDNKFMKFIKYLLFSADNGHKGASSKKIIGYMVAICIVIIHTSWLKNAHTHNDYTLLTTVLTIDYSFIAMLYGLNVTDKKLNDKKPDEPTT